MKYEGTWSEIVSLFPYNGSISTFLTPPFFHPHCKYIKLTTESTKEDVLDYKKSFTPFSFLSFYPFSSRPGTMFLPNACERNQV